ncbi:hypothetical protein AB0D74_48835 [Streptomyces sp. NPDC048278]|uniref:hypothetical protein n=1 Tax=unclassified Streptomyces TaxID=2593676 RepID=UPI0034351292
MAALVALTGQLGSAGVNFGLQRGGEHAGCAPVGDLVDKGEPAALVPSAFMPLSTGVSPAGVVNSGLAR